MRNKRWAIGLISYSLLLTFYFLLSYASAQPIKGPENRSDLIREETPTKIEIPQLEVPELIPMKEDISPLQRRVVSISARNTPLRDVLYTITETANLNLAMERGVDPELPITMTFKSLSVEDALNIITDSVDYFYSIKGNILTVKATGTEIFELGLPPVVQEYQTDLGGDILGGASTEEGQSEIKGDVSMKSTSDKIAFQFWDALENSLKSLLSIKGEAEETVFTVNRMTGSIMVTGTKKQLKKVRDYISNLKKVLNRQVLIEARIVEVQLSEGLKYGIDWSFLDDWQGVGNINIGASRFTDVVETSGPSLQIGITGANFSSLLRALQEQGDVKTLSNPRVNILNGQTALLSVGRSVSFISKVETTTTTAEGAAPVVTFTIETKSVLSGIMFGLIPYINSEAEVTLSITPIVSNLVELEPKTIGAGGNMVEIKLPIVDLREMGTMVKVLDGEMVIIGGLIDRKEKLKEDKVPILGNIPILGVLFKRINKSYEKTELVVMLIPKILNK